jgi:hypothetical protein
VTQALTVLTVVATLMKVAPRSPSWIVGDPRVRIPTKDDSGRTLKIHARFRFWAIRDDHEADCTCGCNGGSFVTVLLPSEY